MEIPVQTILVGGAIFLGVLVLILWIIVAWMNRQISFLVMRVQSLEREVEACNQARVEEQKQLGYLQATIDLMGQDLRRLGN